MQRVSRGGSSSGGNSTSVSTLAGSRGSRGGRRRLTGEDSSFSSDFYYYMNEGGKRGGSALCSSSGYDPGKSPSRSVSVSDERNIPSLASAAGSMQVDSFEEEDLLYTERFPGRKCAFCNLSERSTLGQGDILRLKVSEKVDFTALEKKRKLALESEGSDPLSDKSPKGSLNSARRKGSRKLTSGDQSEPIDELENIGYIEEPDINLLFETSGKCIVSIIFLLCGGKGIFNFLQNIYFFVTHHLIFFNR